MFNDKLIKKYYDDNTDMHAEIDEKLINLNNKIVDVLKKIQLDISDVRKDMKLYIDECFLKLKSDMKDEYYIILNKLIEFNKNLFMTNTQKSSLIDELEDMILRSKWDKEEKILGDKIINKGQEIIKKRNELNDKMMQDERQGKDIKDLKLIISIYDDIIRSVQ